MTRNTVVFFTALLLLYIAVPAWAAGQSSVAVKTAPLQTHRMGETITAFGIVRPDPKAQITRNATYAAFVQTIDVTLGQPVQKGDPLLTLRTAPSARSHYSPLTSATLDKRWRGNVNS